MEKETFADRLFAAIAMLGAVAGAAGGAVLGAEVGSVFPTLCGTLGTMLGSVFAASTWSLLVCLCAGDGVEHNPRESARHETHETHAATPATSAG